MQKQLEHQKKESSDTIPFYYNTWFCLGLIVCLLTAGYLWDYFMSQKIVVTKVEITSAQRQHTQNSSGIKFAKIQDIEGGARHFTFEIWSIFTRCWRSVISLIGKHGCSSSKYNHK
jgi:hypothetical protein